MIKNVIQSQIEFRVSVKTCRDILIDGVRITQKSFCRYIVVVLVQNQRIFEIG